MIKIAILEDNVSQMENLNSLLNKYSKENNLDIEINTFTNSIMFSDSFSPIYDVIFLDIEMPDIDGLTIAKKIRQLDKNTVLIFVTNLLKYATKGYAVNATDYLLKPVKYTDLTMTMGRVQEIISSKEDIFATINTKDGIRRISLNEIYYIEVQKHYLTYHTLKDEYVERGTLKNLEQNMPTSFAKCASCYMVNLKYVSFLDKETVTVGPFNLSVSRRAYPTFLQSLNLFLGRKLN